MVEALIAFLIVVLVVAVIGAVLLYCISLLPIEPNFVQILRALVLLICAVIIIIKAIPLLTMAM